MNNVAATGFSFIIHFRTLSGTDANNVAATSFSFIIHFRTLSGTDANNAAATRYSFIINFRTSSSTVTAVFCLLIARFGRQQSVPAVMVIHLKGTNESDLRNRGN